METIMDERAALAAFAEGIASMLGETEAEPRALLARLVAHLGLGESQRLLKETQAILDAGGMLTGNGQRQRTPGGVFFYLAKHAIPKKQRGQFWPQFVQKERVASAKVPQPPTPAQRLKTDVAEPLVWEQRLDVFANMREGEATTVKIILVGRPNGEKILRGFVALRMVNTNVPKALPTGLPPVPSEPTKYLVFVSPKAWAYCKDALEQDPDDRLIVEGYARYDEQIKGMAIWGIKVSTSNLDKAKREETREKERRQRAVGWR
jgi:hypothetical protein